MTADWLEYQAEMERQARGALESPEPWRVQRHATGWDVVAVVGSEVVGVATAHVREMAEFISSLRNAGR